MLNMLLFEQIAPNVLTLMSDRTLRIATRQSPLALWQANHIRTQLLEIKPSLSIELLPMVTQGDKLLNASLAKFGGKGLFVKELEKALLDKRADLAVHSMKDVPAFFPQGLELSTICQRADPHDAFVSNNYNTLEELPIGASVGTSSLRRQCQIKAIRPDIEVKSLRGNVNTRLQKLDQGHYDAIILAAAGLIRLNFAKQIKSILPLSTVIPCAGQGALGIECRSDDTALKQLLTRLKDSTTTAAVTAERTVSHALGGHCQLPIAAYCAHGDQALTTLTARVGTPDGKNLLTSHCDANPKLSPQAMGEIVAEDLLKQGAQSILDAIEHD